MGSVRSKNRKFMRARIWSIIRHGAKCKEVGERLGYTSRHASHLLNEMKSAGQAKFIGEGRHGVWYAVGPRPVDLRGTKATSLANLKEHNAEWPERLKAALAARGISTTPKRKPPQSVPAQSSCALQDLWRPQVISPCGSDD